MNLEASSATVDSVSLRKTGIRRAAAAALLVCLVAGLASWFLAPDRGVSRYRWTPGCRASYRILNQTGIRAARQSEKGGQGPVLSLDGAFSLAGLLHIRVLGASGKAIRAAAQFTDMELSAAGGVQASPSPGNSARF